MTLHDDIDIHIYAGLALIEMKEGKVRDAVDFALLYDLDIRVAAAACARLEAQGLIIPVERPCSCGGHCSCGQGQPAR